MNLTLATVSVVVIRYNDTTITTSNTIYPQYLPEGNNYLSPRSVLITTIKTTIAGTGRYSPPTPEPTSLVQATTTPRTAGALPPEQTLSAAQELGPSLHQSGTGVVIGTSTSLFTSPGVNTAAAPPALTFGGFTYTAGTSSDFVLDGQTLTKGGIITVDGTQISYNEAGTNVVMGTSTYPLAFPGITAVTKPVLTFDGSTYTIDSLSNFALDGQTLAKGSSITIHGTKLSYDEAGTAVVVGSSTQLLSLATITAVAEPILTFDGSTYIADSSSNFFINGQILSKGNMINVDGTQLSYNQAGTDVVIGTSTQILSTTSVAAAEEPAITFDGSTYLANSASDFIIDGQTLTRGGVITVQGTPISYAAGGTDVVVGTSTEAVGLNGGVISGFGVSSSTPGVAVQFTGEAPRQYSATWATRFISGVLAAILLL